MRKFKSFIKKITKKNSFYSNLFFIFLGIFRTITNNLIGLKFFFVKFLGISPQKSLNISIIGPIHSAHLQSFIRSFNDRYEKKYKIRFQLINSDPNSIVNNFNFNNQIIDKGIYYLLGYRSDYNTWIENIFLNAKNNLKDFTGKYLIKKIVKFKPEIIWIHDLQSAGYLIENALPHFKIELPNLKICASVWGNDLYHFHEIDLHFKILSSILKKVNFLHAESNRDAMIARKLGFEGVMLPVCSITLNKIEAFFDINKLNNVEIKKDIYILIKGSYYLRSNMMYFHDQLIANPEFWIEKKIVIIGASNDDIFYFSKLKNKINLDIEIYTSVPHETFISFLRRSKYHLSCNLSDGVPNTAPEAVYSNCLPLFTNHTGLAELLPLNIRNIIVYDLPTVNFQSLFNELDNNNLSRFDILNDLKSYFELKIFSENIYNDFYNILEV